MTAQTNTGAACICGAPPGLRHAAKCRGRRESGRATVTRETRLLEAADAARIHRDLTPETEGVLIALQRAAEEAATVMDDGSLDRLFALLRDFLDAELAETTDNEGSGFRLDTAGRMGERMDIRTEANRLIAEARRDVAAGKREAASPRIRRQAGELLEASRTGNLDATIARHRAENAAETGRVLTEAATLRERVQSMGASLAGPSAAEYFVDSYKRDALGLPSSPKALKEAQRHGGENAVAYFKRVSDPLGLGGR